MTEWFADLVRDKWAVLTAQHGFAVVSEDQRQVVLDGAALRIVAVHDPHRGEFSAEVYPHGRERWQGWTYAGMVGTASLPRLLELALQEMHADPMVLRVTLSSTTLGQTPILPGVSSSKLGRG